MASKKTRHAFKGKQMDVAWDSRLCIHVAECGKAAGSLFVGGRKPWCQPDLAETEEIRDVVERCPTGALSYQDKSGAGEAAHAENSVHVCCNGPLFLRGELRIEGADEASPGLRFRAALCRCGASKNKPFCDNSHQQIGFADSGAVGETGRAPEQRGGPLTVEPLPDGPLICKGSLAIHAASGRLAWQGDTVALCRCGASKNKPFCDGSHSTIGFRSS